MKEHSNPKFTGEGDLHHIEQRAERALAILAVLADLLEYRGRALGRTDETDAAEVVRLAMRELNEISNVAFDTKELIEAQAVPQ